jgi:hypothetical protein
MLISSIIRLTSKDFNSSNIEKTNPLVRYLLSHLRARNEILMRKQYKLQNKCNMTINRNFGKHSLRCNQFK